MTVIIPVKKQNGLPKIYHPFWCLKPVVSLQIELEFVSHEAVVCVVKGAVSRNSPKLGNYKMPVKLTET